MKKAFIVWLSIFAAAYMACGQPTKNHSIAKKKLKVERLPDLNLARASHAVFYAGDELTVVGGHVAGFIPTATAEYYKGGRWHLINTVYPHDNGISVVMDGGRRVLIAGGHEKNLGIGQTFEAEMYYPESHSFDGFSCMDRKRALFQGTELADGRVLIVGNHMGNDAFEIYDGERRFQHLKEVSACRSLPYIFPVSGGDAIVFGSLWENANCRNIPYDTIDRMRGEPFTEPLLKRWIPLIFDQNSHTANSFVGISGTGEYQYIFAASDDSGNLAFIFVKDTVFSLLPTNPPSIKIDMGSLRHINSAVVDTHSHRAYVVFSDTNMTVSVIAVEYNKNPAPVTIYYSDTIPLFGSSIPVLTPDGNLIVTGGQKKDNFAPLSTVWLLHVGDEGFKGSKGSWGLWIFIGLLLAGGFASLLLFRRRNTKVNSLDSRNPCSKSNTEVNSLDSFLTPTLTPTLTPQENSLDSCNSCSQSNTNQGDHELMARIKELFENEKIYLKHDLQVTHVADALGVHRNTISACINSQQGCTFNQFVNNYRLEHAKKLLSQSPDMKISVVGLESGFANERSFFRSFKAATGMTPGQWSPSASDQ